MILVTTANVVTLSSEKMLPIVDNPLALLNDDDLFETAMILRVGCGRNRAILRRKNRTKVCFLASLLDIELEKRAKPIPHVPYRA